MRNPLPAFALFAVISTMAHGQYAITNVSLIPMTNEGVVADQTVVVKDGKIAAVGPSNKVRVEGGLQVIDGSGKYLLPGLFDMHTHFFSDVGGDTSSWAQELKLMLASGVTTARLMTGYPSYLSLARKTQAGAIPGPELFVVSPQLAGRWHWSQDFRNFELVDTPAKGAEAVRKFKADGYSEIKITFMVNADVYDAIVSTAKEVGIKVTGHVGPLVGLPRALTARQQVEHLDQFIEMLLPDTSFNHGQSVSDFNIYSANAWATVPYLDESRIHTLASMVKQAGISVTPTNYFMISSFGDIPDDGAIMAMPDYGFIPATLKQEKWKHRKSYMSKMAPMKDRHQYVYLRKKMTYELWKAGVPLMAGSDSPEYFIVAGISLHDELRTMVESGLTPFAALQTATTNPARYLGILDRCATIEKGKEARLLLLDANPLDDINNTRSINAVFTKENWYNSADVEKLLDDARNLGR